MFRRLWPAIFVSVCAVLTNQLSASGETAPTVTIASSSQLNDYLRLSPRGATPFDALSPLARRRFLSSLTFNERGLTSFEYVDLRELTASQAYSILKLFGLERGTHLLSGVRISTRGDWMLMHPSSPLPADFLLDYHCAGRGTCARASGFACTSSC
jgi:hypothetical protein